MMKTIMVLMSTYNGELYLKEQIDSILNQSGVNIKLLVRDDGSKDNTTSILEEYKKEGYLDWYSGKNLKPAKSFLDLLKKCDKADYYAFADQDDYWMKNKLSVAVKKLENYDNNNGKLYLSTTNVVDKNLKFIYKSEINDFIDFESAIIKNQATGCTMVIDDNLRKVVNKCKFEYISMHDSWVYRIALLNNSFVYCDNNAYIKYRQHGNNVIGMDNSFLKLWIGRLKRFINSTSESSKTSIELLKNKRYLNKGSMELLELLANYKSNFRYKLKLIFTNKCRSKSMIITILFKIKVLFNKA